MMPQVRRTKAWHNKTSGPWKNHPFVFAMNQLQYLFARLLLRNETPARPNMSGRSFEPRVTRYRSRSSTSTAMAICRCTRMHAPHMARLIGGARRKSTRTNAQARAALSLLPTFKSYLVDVLMRLAKNL